MKINKFEFINKREGWKIQEINFDNLNLLVGGSGVGKTTILRSIDLVFDIAKGKDSRLDGIEWKIEFSHEGKFYKWELESLLNDRENTSIEFIESEETEILKEVLVECFKDQEQEIFSRNPENSRFKNSSLPKLKRSESAISLLSEEEVISPVIEAFHNFSYNFLPQENLIFQLETDPQKIQLGSDLLQDLEEFKRTIVQFPTVFKALLLQNHFENEFNLLKDNFLTIFPEIQGLRIHANQQDSGGHAIFCEIQEQSSKSWIPQNRISSGMLRSLYLLFELFLAPQECVILIDEFENSLGVNCMPEVANLILEYESSIQFILTSHHPYIINNIPWKQWQLVSRSSNTIKATKASDIPELETASSLDKFTQLINYLEYKELTT